MVVESFSGNKFTLPRILVCQFYVAKQHLILRITIHFVQTRYYWAEELNDRVYNDWVKKAGERLKDMVSKAMTRPDNEIIPWLPTPLRSRLKAFRETEDFKKRSRQNSINKRTGPKAGTVHTAGSISAEQTAKKMVISLLWHLHFLKDTNCIILTPFFVFSR